MMPYVRLSIALLLALGWVAVNDGTSWAAVGPSFDVKIDDLTDIVSVTVVADPLCSPCVTPPSPTILPDSRGEFLHFTLPGPDTSITTVHEADLFEDPAQTILSDQLIVSGPVGLLDVVFVSDPVSFPCCIQFRQFFTEDGTFQFVGSGGGPSGSAYAFLVRSDIVEQGDSTVPEPATLLLLGTGLAGLAGLNWRRQRRT